MLVLFFGVGGWGGGVVNCLFVFFNLFINLGVGGWFGPLRIMLEL